MTRNNPTHPGESIRLDCMEPLSLSVTKTAEGLGVSRNTMSEILNGRAGISAEMAVRLELAGWGTAASWLSLQRVYDLAHVNRDKLMVRQFSHPEPA